MQRTKTNIQDVLQTISESGVCSTQNHILRVSSRQISLYINAFYKVLIQYLVVCSEALLKGHLGD